MEIVKQPVVCTLKIMDRNQDILRNDLILRPDRRGTDPGIEIFEAELIDVG